MFWYSIFLLCFSGLSKDIYGESLSTLLNSIFANVRAYAAKKFLKRTDHTPKSDNQSENSVQRVVLAGVKT